MGEAARAEPARHRKCWLLRQIERIGVLASSSSSPAEGEPARNVAARGERGQRQRRRDQDIVGLVEPTHQFSELHPDGGRVQIVRCGEGRPDFGVRRETGSIRPASGPFSLPSNTFASPENHRTWEGMDRIGEARIDLLDACPGRAASTSTAARTAMSTSRVVDTEADNSASRRPATL